MHPCSLLLVSRVIPLTLVLALAILRSSASPAFYNTGVDSNSQQLPGGSPDPHYQLRQVIPGGYTGSTNWSPAITMQSSIAWPQWLQPPDARWIYIADAANLGQDWGTYEYMTTFDLTGYDPSTAVLAGKCAVDQYGSIYLNSNLVATLPDGNWNNNLTSFSITSGFVPGTNTLAFYIRQPDGGDGMIVSGASLTATALPQPTTIFLVNPGVRTNRFGFTATGSSNFAVVVIEACTNVGHPAWSPIATNSLSLGPFYFSDPQWTIYPTRYYRARSP
jgi:hypothetical protein